MNGKGRTGTALALILVMAASLVGCGKMTKPDRENGYATQYAMSAAEYTIFLSEETAVLENVLSTRMATAKNVIDGTYDPAKEIENVEEATSKIVSLQTAVLTTMPAQGYESDREALLGHVEDAKQILERYGEALASRDVTTVASLAEEMKSTYVAASGDANVFYE